MQKPSNSKIKECSSAHINFLFECAHCKQKADKSNFKLCSGCYKAHYCSKECQMAQRKLHKVTCKTKAIKTNNLNSAIDIPKDDNTRDIISFCKGDVEGLQIIISRGVDLRALLSDKQIAFAVLTELLYGHFYDCAELLLQHNVNINAQNEEGFTILMIACQEGFEEFVSLLLRYNADPNIRTIDGSSPLSKACSYGYSMCVSLLLQHNVNPNITNNDGFSSLHAACLKDHEQCVSLLLQHNADPNIVDNDGSAPLHTASNNGNDKCVSLLLQAGGNTEQVSSSGCTPLLVACYRGHLKCAALLVEHGADINVQSADDMYSILYVSCFAKNFNLVAYILSLGVDVNTDNSYGTTPLQYCQSNGLEKFVKLLIEHGAQESTMNEPLPLNAVLDNISINKLRAENKELRQKAKHCDYPDCCNEGNDSQSLHACSSCRAVYYCSREHQEAHWKEHKKLCKAIKK